MALAHTAHGSLFSPRSWLTQDRFPQNEWILSSHWGFVRRLVLMPNGLGLNTPPSEKHQGHHCVHALISKAVGFAFLVLPFHSDICWSSAGIPGAVHKGP